ncbi:hypothetical protein ANANG_G00023980 [Anguilla anguilla]|uniref:Zinc finger FYVE domain-containing protein 26 n=1 Tax=Anguilla anguilla TaxID=7936 RepID=A0A9D3N039_ANGAN|nr:hypothetical protein ANANG_G00023980 [Anguilla anguilla]
MHPFGREEESSLQQLFGFFTQCARRGEWELARACVPQLREAAGGPSERLQDILRALVTCPYPLRWETVGSPHRLAWFWLQVLERWSEEQVAVSVRRELEFLLVLEELGAAPGFPGLRVGGEGVAGGNGGAQRRGGVLSPGHAGGGAAATRPGPRRLPAGPRARRRRPGEGPRLQGALTEFLLERVARLGPGPEHGEGAEQLCCALAVTPWDPERTGWNLALCEALWSAGGRGLREERVLGSLLRPGDHALLGLYCSTALRLQRDQLLRDTSSTQVDIPEAERLMLGLCCHGDRESAWKAIYFESLSSGKHFLELVLVTALDLVRKEEFGRLECLLRGEFRPLSRLLLLLGWTQCQSMSSAQTLLHTLHHSQALANDAVLKEFADGVSSQLGVLEWCAKNNPGILNEALLGQLHTLDSHSALYILHCLTPLAQLDEQQVLGLLQGLPHPPGSGDPDLVDEPNLSVGRNVVLFQGLCAMKYALYALCVNAHKYSGCRDCGLAEEPHQAEAGVRRDSDSTLSQECPPLFQQYLSECQLYLEAVPAVFRLELLENIFSLLFLSSADFIHQGAGSPRRGAGAERRHRERRGRSRTEGERGRRSSSPALEPGATWTWPTSCGAAGASCGRGRRGPRPAREAEVAEGLGCSVTAEAFAARLQRLSNRTAEAQWRLQIIASNHGSGRDLKPQPSPAPSPTLSLRRSGSAGGRRRRKRAPKHRLERRVSTEKQNGEVSTSTSDGGGGAGGGQAEREACPCGGPHSWLVPAMLSPPESLLMSCIRRGNFVEAHQVSLMFGLEGSACCGELVFMERYREVLLELAAVEHKIESQSSTEAAVGVTGPGRGRLSSNGRASTLQAIESAAAAGMAFYSISDVADRLLSTRGTPCPRWRRGLRIDSKVRHCEGIRGFPAVLQGISKILNHTSSGKGSAKTEAVSEEQAGLGPVWLQCAGGAALLPRHALTEEGISARLSLAQRLELTLHTLGTATDASADARAGGGLLSALLEQASLRPSELDSHPVRSHMKHLLRSLDHLCPFEPDGAPCRPDYVRSFLDYVNTLASVLVRSVAAEDQAGEVKLGNPLLVLLQSPSQLLSHLLFDRQVSPDRVSSLLQQESLGLSVQQVIVQRCSPVGAGSPGRRPAGRGSPLLPGSGRRRRWTASRWPGRARPCSGTSPSCWPTCRPWPSPCWRPGAPRTEGRGWGGAGRGPVREAPAGPAAFGLYRPSTRALVADAFQQALASQDLDRALGLLELYGQNCSQEGALRDRLLACAALEEGEGSMEQLFRVRDADLRARVALRGLERWPLGAALELLQFCLSDPSTEGALRAELELRRQELEIYNRMLNMNIPLPWTTWQELRADSRSDSETVFSMMLEASEFELCAQWEQLYPVSAQLRLQLQTEHLLHLLEKGQTEEAFQLLENVPDSAVGLEVCERALDRRPGLAACHFLSDYLTLHFQSRVLLTLPTAAQQDYFPLLSNPLLMLEQLLMNLKVDWAGVAVHTLRSLLIGQEASFSGDDIDALLSGYARKALDVPYAPRERTRSAGSTPQHAPPAASGLAGRRTRSPAQYIPPEKPPHRKDWIPDHQQPVCMVCLRERFTMFNRRHHCRRCGRLVCNACSEHRMAVEGCAEEAARVCDQCYSFFHLDAEGDVDQAEVAGSPAVAEGAFGGVLCLPEVAQHQYKLSLDPAENQQLLSEFYYEQAPSASLCIAILSLHSDHSACGRQLIAHCRALSRGLTNPEVDARLLTDLMRQLLFSAKLMFVKVGRNQDLALCDSYISKVDVLKILVTANYKYIPSLDDILEQAAVTRLRNQLLEAEYYQLAVEVSTKSGLDPGGVWQAWGMASLKAGNLSVAREKFSRCLKAPVDRNQLSQGPRLLQEIIQYLESTVRPTLSPNCEEDVLASLRELEEALSDPGPTERPEGGFYMRHDSMKEALCHVLSKECPDEVFLEGVLQPSLERGRLWALQGLLESLDPGLEGCGRYLMASCQQLQRRGHFRTLYQLQQFMMVRPPARADDPRRCPPLLRGNVWAAMT